MEIFTRFFWALALPVTLLNVAILTIRARPILKSAPELQATFRSVMRGFVLLMNAPFFVMGFGVLFGGVPNIFYYFRPQDLNPYVLAFHASVLAVWAVLLNWVWMRDGAVFLSKLHHVFHVPKNPLLTKLFVLLLVGAGIAAIVGMVLVDFPVDEFKF